MQKQSADRRESVVISNTEAEFEIDKQNHTDFNDDYELYLGMYNLIPDSPEEEWMSNVPLPEFLSEMTTQMSIEAAQEFKRRDFVEVFPESKDKKHLLAGEAKKELINRTLNQKHIHYFQKRMRASGIKNISGNVYFRCMWERKVVQKTELKDVIIPLENPREDGQQQAVIPVEVQTDHVLYDRFNLDVLDPRNVFVSPEYTYSLQDKKRVTIRYNTNIEEMTLNQDYMGYINLDKVKSALKNVAGGQTSVIQGSDSEQTVEEYQYTSLKSFSVLEVYLTEWVIPDAKGGITPGYDSSGNPEKKAVLMKIIKSIADIGGKKILVRYQRNKFRDAFGNAYLPIVQGKCYVHPTDDLGFGDGKASYPLETARNGMFNMGINRVTLATLPAVKASSASAQEFGRTWQFEPRAIFETLNPADLQEFQLSDDISGVAGIMSILTNSQQQSNATFPTIQGALPKASTSATATAASESRTDARSFYKGLVYNNTALMEIYDIISLMTWQFALPETAEKLMGEKVIDFNPYLEHTFKTVTATLETESSKQIKIGILDNMFMQIAQVQNKNTLKALNYITQKKFMLLGDEYEEINDILFDEEENFVAPPSQGSLPANGQPGQPTNQTGLQQSGTEQALRQIGGQN